MEAAWDGTIKKMAADQLKRIEEFQAKARA